MSITTSENQHENFSINTDDEISRRKIVRQDRLVPEGDCHLEIQGVKYQVLNYNSFGIAIKGDLQTQEKEEFFSIPFTYENVEVGAVHLRAVGKRSLEADGEYMAFEIFGQPLPMDTIDAVKMGCSVVQSYEDQLDKESLIPKDFKLQVYEIREVLSSLKEQIDELEESRKLESTVDDEGFDEALSHVIGNFLTNMMEPIYKDINRTMEGLSDELSLKCMEYFRSKMKDLVFKSPFANRSYQKPLGYAGDFEMMNLIYNHKKLKHSLFVRCLDKLFVEAGAAQAVKNRSQYLKSNIHRYISESSSDVKKVLSLACGPAMEVQLVLREGLLSKEDKVEFHLMDQDLNALKHTQMRLEIAMREGKTDGNTPIQTYYHNLAVKNVIGGQLKNHRFDLIYTAGLFDYLSDPVAQITAKKLWESLNPGGELIIGNFNVDNPNQVTMEMILDWKLLYRSEKDMAELFTDLGGDVYIGKEQNNINLFCHIKKK